MPRPSKFDLMRANRRVMRTAALREEARDLGYDEEGDLLDLMAKAREELDAVPHSHLAPLPARKPWWWWPLPMRRTQ